MMRSLYTGVSGMRNHQTRMDVLSNNIANVNTTGYKASRTVFSDALSQTLQGASGPSANLGGVNAKQIGLGVQLSSIDILFTPTSFQTTNKYTDLAINNDGFFIIRDGAQQFYTRAGNFDFDKEGNMIVNGTGLKVMGWMADANGNVNPASPIEPIKVPVSASMPARVSTTVTANGNLKSNDNLGGATTSSDDLYDSQGNKHRLTTTYTKLADNTWLAYTAIEGVDPTTITPGNPDGINGNVKVVTFDANGVFSASQDAGVPGTVTGAPPNLVINGAFSAPITLDQTAQLADKVEGVISFVDQNGVAKAVAVRATCTTAFDGVNDAIWKLEFLEQGKLVGSSIYPGNPVSTTMPTMTLNDGTTYSFPAATTVTVGAAASNLNVAATTQLPANTPLSFQPAGGTAFMNLNQTFNALAQSAVDHDVRTDADGYAAGTLMSKSIDDKGNVVGFFSNDQRLTLAQLSTAIFNNQAGLERMGSTMFRESNNSGAAQIGTAGTAGRGTMQAGVLEMSNVDLAEEFTNMIVTQRGYQSNSRVITTSDEMLQELMSLKR